MNKKPHHPIGIFDSGVGGLTVAKAVTELLPQESVVYFGDTAHLPWGDKSVSAIQQYSVRIAEVLLEHQCKVILIACNTASAAAYEAVKQRVGDMAHVINVIDSVVAHVGEHYSGQKLGLIGTKQTVRLDTYRKRISGLNKNIDLHSLATPLLVPLIEEGFLTSPATESIVQQYLRDPAFQDIQGLILGCTHYPLIKSHVQSHFNHAVKVIDSAELVSHALKQSLLAEDLLNAGTLPPKRLFYVSDDSEFFVSMVKLFFDESVHLEAYSLWD